jgi:phosphohistidine phosphatase
MRLILVRHAEAGPGEPDDLRRLTAEGLRQARELGERLAEAEPDAILSSPLVRARETADAISLATGADVRIEERLAPGATAAGLREAAREAAGSTIVAVGHQPDCGEIATALTGSSRHRFPPAGFLALDLP